MKKIVQSLLFSALALVIIVACSKDDEPVAPAKFNIDLTSKDFGDVEINQTTSQDFKIINSGGQDLELNSFTLTGTNTSEFTTNAVKKVLKAGKDYSFTVNFAPTTKGNKTTTVNIVTNVGSKKITLQGNAITCATPVNIVDVNFKNLLLAHGASAAVNGVQPITGRDISLIDTNNDGEICTDEAQAYTGTINVYNKGVSDLTGIEAFINLTVLDCSKNQLTNLDVTQNTALEGLYCGRNSIESLDVTQNTALKNLECSRNKLTDIDVTKNTNLKYLNVIKNQLTSINVTKNTALTSLSVDGNKLKTLNTSKNIDLIILNCGNNELDDVLDLSKNTKLTRLNCENNKLSVLNIANSNNSNMTLMNALNNSNPNFTTCIQHDSGFTPNGRWMKDNSASWSTTDCIL